MPSADEDHVIWSKASEELRIYFGPLSYEITCFSSTSGENGDVETFAYLNMNNGSKSFSVFFVLVLNKKVELKPSDDVF